MANYNKIIYGGKTLIDLTGDTVTEDKLLAGYTAHKKDGSTITGTCPYDMDTSEMNAAADEILAGKTAGIKGTAVTGTMPNNGAVDGRIAAKDDVYTIPRGYHDGSGTAQLAETEKAKLIAENIRQGVTLLGVEGSMSGTEDANPQSVEVTPSTSEQVVLPDTDAGYNYIAQVTVKPIPYSETENSAGGMTVTIG